MREPIKKFKFGEFEFDRQKLELRRNGFRTKLQGQPLRLLVLLLDAAGDVVTRDQMRAQLWPEDTFVDFEHSLNSAIKKLRRALSDSATEPRFIETVARQGYRFIGPLETPEVVREEPSPAEPLAIAPQLSPQPSPMIPAKRPSLWVYAIPIVISAAVVALAVYLHVSRPQIVRTDGSGLTLLLASQGEVQDPAISPDGTMLAYSRAQGGSARIYLRRLAGGTTVPISRGAWRDAEPAFSPDSERIAFTSYPPNAAAPEVWISPVLGGELHLVIQGARNPAWSPDGGRLALILERPGLGDALAISSTDGSGVRIILDTDATFPFLHFPSWSADGRSIAVERSLGGVSGEIWLVPSRGGPPKPVDPPAPGIYMHHPVFTPDGKGLLYSSNRSGAINLWYYSLKNGAAMVITRGPGPEEWPSISRGGRIVFLNNESRDTLFLRRLDTGASRAIVSHAPFLWSPSISPDCRTIAFSQGEYDGSWRIWKVSAMGGEPEPVTSGREPQIYGRFSRDGRWITYFSWAARQDRIWRIPSGGGYPEPLTPANEDAAYADLSPNGREVAFTRTESHSVNVYIRLVGGGGERRLTSAPSTVPRWSPDGQWIAYSPDRSFQSGIFIIHPDGSGAKRLTQSGSWPIWVGDGKSIAFRTLGGDGNQQLNLVRVSDSKVTPLKAVQFSGSNYPVDFSSDGKLLAYTNGATFSSEVWLLSHLP